jgi:hypothetical protein
MPPIFEIEGKGIFPIDNVLGVIEVKSKLSSADYPQILQAAEKLIPRSRSPKGMHIATPGTASSGIVTYPSYSVFAFESDAKDRDEYDRIKEKSDELGIQLNVHAICVLSKGIWIIQSDQVKKKITTDKFDNAKNYIIYRKDRDEYPCRSFTHSGKERDRRKKGLSGK